MGDLVTKIGYDESGNGHHKTGNGHSPETHVLVYSSIPSDLTYKECSMKKIRNHQGINMRIQKRGYSFLSISERERARISQKDYYKKLGVVLASLLTGETIGDHLEIYLDGEWFKGGLDFARDALKDLTGLAGSNIDLISGPRFDISYRIVNMADEIAHWVRLRRRSLDELEKDSHRKILLLENFSR